MSKESQAKAKEHEEIARAFDCIGWADRAAANRRIARYWRWPLWKRFLCVYEGQGAIKDLLTAIRAHPVEIIAVARTNERGQGGERAEQSDLRSDPKS